MERNLPKISVRRQLAIAEDTRREAEILPQDQLCFGQCDWERMHDWMQMMGSQQFEWQKEKGRKK